MQTPPFDTIARVDGARFVGLYDEVWTNRLESLGPLHFPSGRVVVADALATGFSEYPALEYAVPERGEAYVAIGERDEQGRRDKMILASWVEFDGRKGTKWVPAYFEGHDPDDDYLPGFGVDSGTACIADARVAARLDDEASGELAMNALYDADGRPAEHVFHPGAPDHFLLTVSGMGDGYYTAYWWVDDAGEPAGVAVDFGLMTRTIWQTARIPLPLSRGPIVHETFERVGAKVHVPRFPPIGRLKLRIEGGVSRVRYMDGDTPLRSLTPKRMLRTSTYDLGKPEGTHLEIAFRFGREPAEPVE
jgi:hypothetical protein